MTKSEYSSLQPAASRLFAAESARAAKEGTELRALLASGEERLRIARRQAGECEKCGKKLGFFERVGGAALCSSCR